MNQTTQIISQGQGDFGKNFFSASSSSGLVPSNPVISNNSTTETEPLGSIVNNSNTDIERLLKTDRWNINRNIHQALITEGIITKRRYTDCMCKTVGGKEVELRIHPKRKQVSTQNLITCKSVWVCAVCRSRLLAKKAKTIESVVKKSKTNNVMITFTCRHKNEDKLEELVDGVGKAFRDLRSDRVWLKMKKRFSHSWDVRNMETTWGQRNGWHIHIHQLVGFSSKMTAGDIDLLQYELFPVWRRLLKKYGMRDIEMKYGLDVIKADQAAAYLTKWNISKELSSGDKTAQNGNQSIGDMELENLKYSISRDYRGSVSHSQIKWNLAEYYKVMEGRKFLVVGGEYNKLVKENEDAAVDVVQEDEFGLAKDDVVYVNGYFWYKLMKSGYANGFIRQLETREIPDAMDWLQSKIRNSDLILDNVRIVIVAKEKVKEK